MKEVESKSPWVGKVLTCRTCNRSFKVEAGDVIVDINRNNYFKLLCGCWKRICINVPEDVY